MTSGGTPRRRWRRRLESPGGDGMSCAGAWMARLAPMAKAAHFAGFHASRVVDRPLLEHEHKWTNCALMTDGVPSERCPTQIFMIGSGTEGRTKSRAYSKAVGKISWQSRHWVLSAGQLHDNEGTICDRRLHATAALAAAPRVARWRRHALRGCMDASRCPMAAAALFARFHASHDTGACRPTSCLNMCGQTVR